MRISRRSAFAKLLLGGVGYVALLRSASADTVTYTYDALGRVVGVAYADGSTITYVYDAAGNRTQVTQTSALAPSGTLTATPSTISPGGSSTLSWTSAYAVSGSINNGIGSVALPSGSTVVSPSVTTTYTLTLTNAVGTANPQATVTVSAGFNQTIQITGTGPVNLRTLADAAGYNGAQNATVVFEVGSGVTITGAAGSPTGGVGIDTGTWPGGYTINLTLVIKTGATVRAGGGRGGIGGGPPTNGQPGSAGGDAIYLRTPLTGGITVQSGATVQGGGGGGGGGAGFMQGQFHKVGGGGGGGGRPNGPGGPIASGMHYPAQSGSAGTATANGVGGAGGNDGDDSGGSGANGGTFAAAGASAPSGGAGGAAGYAIRKNGHTATVTNNGTITGTVG